MLEKAPHLPADEVILDLEDSVAPLAKSAARKNLLHALERGDWRGKIVAVRINALESDWADADIDEVIGHASNAIDCVILPKVQDPETIESLAARLSSIDRHAATGRIGIEVQIEDPIGLARLDAIVNASERVETLIFGPGDFMASMQVPTLSIGVVTGPSRAIADAAMVQLALAARRNGIQVIDGPYAAIDDHDGFRDAAEYAAGLGFDGKWVLHPTQIDACNLAFRPDLQLFRRALSLLDSYNLHRSDVGGQRGAAMFGDDMIDEASRKLAEVIVERGLRAGLTGS